MASSMAPSSLFSSSSSSSSSSLRVFGCRNAVRIGINRPTIFVVNALAKQQPSRQNTAKPSSSSSSSKRPADPQRGVGGDDNRYRSSRSSSTKNVSSRNQNRRSSGTSNRGTAGYGYGGGGNVKREQSLKREQLYRGGSKNSRNYVEEVVDEEEEEDDDDDDDDDYDDEIDEDDDDEAYEFDPESLLLPRPPAGFILDRDGTTVSLMAPPNKRITTIVDPATKLPLDCLIRRVFSSIDARQCFLLCPLDTPVQILRIDGEDKVLKEITDEELEDIFPTASYELAKRRLHLTFSGYCLTLRGGFCYSENDLMDVNTVYGGSGDHSLREGVEVASFRMNDSEYLVYSPFDPLMFVAYKDEDTGELIIADDDLLEDEAVLDAIDEEKEFQAYVDEEIAMKESLEEEADFDEDN